MKPLQRFLLYHPPRKVNDSLPVRVKLIVLQSCSNQTQEKNITYIPFHLYKTNPLNNAMYNAIK